MLSAYHIWTTDTDCTRDGEPAYQWDNHTGYVDDSYSSPRLDYASISENNSNGIEYSKYIRYSYGSTTSKYEICGRASNYDVLMSDGTTIYKTGRRTDTQKGKIDDTSWGFSYGCTSANSDEGIRLTNNQADGDSGSVAWIIDDVNGTKCAAIVSIVTAATGEIGSDTCSNTGKSFSVFDYSFGAKSEAIYNDNGGDLTFG